MSSYGDSRETDFNEGLGEQKADEGTKINAVDKKCYMTIWSVMTAIIAFGYIILRANNLPCARPTLKANFDISKFLGNWYEIRRSYGMPFEFGDCATA